MIRDLAEETVDGSAFDDFSASAIIGRQVGVMSNWFVQSPNDTRSCRKKVDGSAFDDFSASSMLAIIGIQVGPGLCLIGLFKVPMIRDLAEKKLMDQLLTISVLLLCWQ